jgi:hypothetical protein
VIVGVLRAVAFLPDCVCILAELQEVDINKVLEATYRNTVRMYGTPSKDGYADCPNVLYSIIIMSQNFYHIQDVIKKIIRN